MYNWRLLLLAFFAGFQPIASFTERSLVDGRQQCCDHRLSRDSANSLYGANRFKSEGRRINDREEIREARSDDPTVNTFRNFYRDRDIRVSSELRTRLSGADLQREREVRLRARETILTPDRARNYRATDSRADRNVQYHRDKQSRILRTDKTRIFRQRHVDENLDQRNIDRRAENFRAETKLMRAYVDEVRRIRDIRDTRREESRRTRNNGIRTDRLRTLSNERVHDFVDRRASATYFVLRNELSVRSQERGNNADRRLSFENARVAREESVNQDARSKSQDRHEMKNLSQRRNIETQVRERSGDEEFNSRLSTRPVLRQNQRSVRSLDRVLRGSNDDRRISFENVRVAEQERKSRNVRARVRDEIGNVAERRNVEIRDRERLDVDSRFSMTRLLARNQRSVRSVERLSSERMGDRIVTQERNNRDVRTQERNAVRSESERRNTAIRVRQRSDESRDIPSREFRPFGRSQRLSRNTDRTISVENLRIIKQERENRDTAMSRNVRERDNIMNVAERRMNEIRVRERAQLDREIDSRVLLTRRSSIDSSRRNMELRMTSNRIDRKRHSDEGYGSDQRVSRERNEYDQRTAESQNPARSHVVASRMRTVERITNQIRNIRQEARQNYRDDRLEREGREMSGRRVPHSKTRLSENRRRHRYLNARVRDTDESMRTRDKRIVERIQNQRLREISRTFERRVNYLRTQIRNDEMREQRNVERASRDSTVERRSNSERIGSEQRDAREIQRRITEFRDSRYRDNERLFRTTSESRLSSRIIERDSVHNVERIKMGDVDERRKPACNVIAPKTTQRLNIDTRTKSNDQMTRNIKNTFEPIENEKRPENNWQNLIYTVQGIYLCSIFITMLMNKNNDKKKVKLSLNSWASSLQKLIKTD